MIKCSLSWFIIFLTFLDVFVKTHIAEHDNHGFITKQQERYLVNDISSIHEEITSSVRGAALDNAALKLLLKFDPEYLDFKLRPLGVPHLEKVTLFNVDNNKTVDMTSISGSTVHFHSSFFEDKRIPPLGNTTFNVVFLGREEGPIESNLFIHTTEGHFKYQVKGASVSSPYRLRPIVGVKLPLNTTFTPLIYMHNPYMEPIQIVEIYSSGGEFHLELPSGELEGPKDMWEIPPLETKAVIRVRFHAKMEHNHTAYVRIKLNNTQDVLVVPLEVEVTPDAGVYACQGFVDFGVGGFLDAPKQAKLQVSNPLKKPVRVHSIVTDSKAIKIDYEGQPVVSEATDFEHSAVDIATLTLDWKAAFENQDFSGKIVVKYKNGRVKTEIPYYITVLEGGLIFNSSNTTYFISDGRDELVARDVVLKNGFQTPVALIDISFPKDVQESFYVSDFKPMILKPQEEATVFTLKLKPDAAMSDLRVNSYIRLKTNVSTIELPLLSYNGKLQLFLPYINKNNALDLGLVSLDSKKQVYFLVSNFNPLPIYIKKISTSLADAKIETIGCGSGDAAEALMQDLSRNSTKCKKIKPNEHAIIRIIVQSPQVEGQVMGKIRIETQFEEMSFTVQYKCALGKLEIGPDRLVFDQCFPGKLCSHPLRVHSTFSEHMYVVSIHSIPPDVRITNRHTGHILAHSTKIIGQLFLDPKLSCHNECYTGLDKESSSKFEVQWFKSLNLSRATTERDLTLVNGLYNRYLNQTANGQKTWQNLTMRLDTSEVRGHMFKTRVKMSWPSLVVEQHFGNKTTFTFPLTQVGNVTYQNITIKNPSSHVVGVQIIFEQSYPDSVLLHEGLPPDFIPSRPERSGKRGFFFHPSYTKHWGAFKALVDVEVQEDCLPVLLGPGQNITFSVGFKAEDSSANTALLFLRNNLTILEIIRLNAQGAHPNFKFGNRKPSSPQPLLFELTEKHLKDCERDKVKKYPVPNLTVKRTFTARNIGDIPIFVNKLYINELPCEGFGFKILNCEAFVLPANSTKKIDIAFTPDFTLAKITRTLILESSLNFVVNYTLMTTIPPYYLSLCSNVLARPTWEVYLYYIAVCLMCFLLGFVVVMPIMESERILKQAIGVMISRSNITTQPTLDLRLVGAQTRSEIRTQKSDSESEPKSPTPKESKCPDPKPQPKSDPPVETAEEKSPKIEPEKYTALIPATGKSKKRLSKKNSNEISEPPTTHELLPKKVCLESQKPVPKRNPDHQQKSPGEVENARKAAHKENKKFAHCKKHKNFDVCEEETSSTTTESSNNDEPEKDEKPKTPDVKKPPSPKFYPETQPLMELPVDSNQIVKVEQRKRNSIKPIPKNKERDCSEMKAEKYKSKATTAKERKEKLAQNRKQSDKKQLHESLAHITPITRVSPTVQFNNVWGENRATFSDVVARNDTVPTGRAPLAQPQLNKPTMYVEPYKQKVANLGPIGSRKYDHFQDNSFGNQHALNFHEQQQQHQQAQLSNSFFSEGHTLGLDAPNSYLPFNSDELWDQRNTSYLMNLMQSGGLYLGNQQNLLDQDPWQQSLNSPDMWDSSPPFSPISDGHQENVNSQSGYLWGSSPVWQPWAPAELPRTPTRTPPGFAPNPDLEDRLQPRNSTYNPFGTSSIWTQEQSNPWNYPQGP